MMFLFYVRQIEFAVALCFDGRFECYYFNKIGNCLFVLIGSFAIIDGLKLKLT